MRTYRILNEHIMEEYYNSRGDHPEYWDHWQNIDNRKDFNAKIKRKVKELNFLFSKVKKGVVLEAGCGMGQVVAAFEKKGVKAIGVDYSENIIESSKKIQQDLELVLGNISNLPFPDKNFSHYICLGVIEHYQDADMLKKIFNEAKRVTREGFYFTVPYFSPALGRDYDKKRLNENLEGKEFYQYYFTSEGIKNLLKKYGFEPVECNYFMTIIGLRLHNAFFRFFYTKINILRYIAWMFLVPIDKIFGRKYGRMIGVYCICPS